MDRGKGFRREIIEGSKVLRRSVVYQPIYAVCRLLPVLAFQTRVRCCPADRYWWAPGTHMPLLRCVSYAFSP